MEDFVIALLVVILIVCIAFLIRAVAIQGKRADTCQAGGYAWKKMFAGTDYCIRIEDGGLIGVPLTTLE